MDSQTKQSDIMARYADLPEDLQNALVSSSFSNAITEVGKQNGLAIDKVGELADETGLVMLGITSPSDYVKNLVSRLSVSQEKARAIAEEINQKVFQPVRESLKKIHGLPAGKAGIAAPSSTLGVESPKTPSVLPGAVKPLPKREDIVVPSIPPIFVKKMPEPIVSKPDIIPPPKESVPQNSLAAKSALEKELSAPPSAKPSQYKEKDPYREIIE